MAAPSVGCQPPAWYFPIRHLLGAELLADGQAAEAEAVYRKDLEQYPANGWSLFGLAEALEAQGKSDEAATVRGEFEQAWQGADVVLTSSVCPCDSAEKAPAAAAGEEIDTTALAAELASMEEKGGIHHHGAEVIVLSQDAVVLLYPLGGEGDTQADKEYGASLWVKHGDGWQKVLLQAMPNTAE